MDDVLSKERAIEAAVLFFLDDFDGALQTLQRIEGASPGDARVRKRWERVEVLSWNRRL